MGVAAAVIGRRPVGEVIDQHVEVACRVVKSAMVDPGATVMTRRRGRALFRREHASRLQCALINKSALVKRI
jgi:hypothetical protein